MSNDIDWPLTPITEQTFKRQKWERYDEVEVTEDGTTKYHYYMLPLPKDNPDDNGPILVSSADDEWEELGLKKGEYYVEVCDFFGLGMCRTEEELEILYRALTKRELE